MALQQSVLRLRCCAWCAHACVKKYRLIAMPCAVNLRASSYLLRLCLAVQQNSRLWLLVRRLFVAHWRVDRDLWWPLW